MTLPNTVGKHHEYCLYDIDLKEGMCSPVTEKRPQAHHEFASRQVRREVNAKRNVQELDNPINK